MADKKVSELEEQIDLNGVQAVGVKLGDGTATPCRYDVGNVQQSIYSSLQGIISPNGQNPFDQSKNYYIGQFCTHDSKLYKFVKTHWSGIPWTLNDVVETDLLKEFNSYTAGEYETLSASVNFINASGTELTEYASLKANHDVMVSFDDNTFSTNRTNEDGITTFVIRKGQHYTLSTVPVCGFTTPAPIEFTSTLSTSSDTTEQAYGGRCASMFYTLGCSSKTCSVTAHIMIDGIGGTAGAPYSGKDCTLTYPHGEWSSRSMLSPITDQIFLDSATNDYVAVFDDVKQGMFCSILMQNVDNYRLEEEYGFFVNGSSMNVYVNVSYDDNYGIFYLCGDNYDPDPTLRTPEENRWKEYRIEDYPGYGTETACNSAMYPCSAVHVKPKELAMYNADYYVFIKDLTTERKNVASKAWCLTNQEHPHVTKNYYNESNPTQYPRTAIGANGRLATLYMMIDSNRVYGTTSPAAEYAVSKTLTFFEGTANEKTAHGFIGTRDQWSVILDSSVASSIDTALKWFGYTGQNYRTGTYWWSSCQYSAAYAWSWGSSGTWSNTSKAYSYYVLPFFAIYKL